MDLIAAVEHPVTLAPGARALVGTGIMLELPLGLEAQIRPRSGLAFNHGITVLNSPGTIDADYRGEVKVLLINHGAEAFQINPGVRIAQMVVAPVIQAQLDVRNSLTATGRGDNGFGSTGIHSTRV
jgi:dUTP pyrophosphatase